MSGPRGLVVGWMPYSRRSRTLAEGLGYDVLLLGRRGFRRPWTAAFSYPLLAVQTAAAILRRRPTGVIVIAPPFVAAYVAVPMARLLGARVVIDVHTGALVDRRWRWSIACLAWVGRRSDGAVVTLPSLATALSRRGVRTLVMADPLPPLRTKTAKRARTRANPLVVAVCGWGDDEPIEQLIAAAADEDWELVITGRPRRKVNTPTNVKMAGFLDDEAYVDLLATADLVVALTTRDDTLLSGAWEALSLERPLLVSATVALQTTFGSVMAAVEPNAASIRYTITEALERLDDLQQLSVASARTFRIANNEALGELRRLLNAS